MRPLLLLAVLLGACASTNEPMRLVSPDAPIAETTVVDRGSGEPPVDRSCRVNADCAVKNVGNCCGYYPACVHRNSPTYPERVRARCQREGMASVCGFPEIAGCVCVAGRCEPTPGGDMSP
jgi:hypothetical protein